MATAKNPKGSNLKPFYLLLGIVALVGLALIVYQGRKGKGAGEASTAPVDLQSLDARALLEKARGVKVGPDSAKVQVMVFSDYMCPACGYFATNIQPLIEEQFAKTGKVQFTYYDFPLGGTHVHSFLAARAARCAEDQGKFHDYHSLLFRQQNGWSFAGSPPVDQFNDFAQQLGLDAAKFQDCLNSDAHAELVTANYQLGQQLGVNATPTVIINGRRSTDPNTWDVLKAEIERELGQ